MSLSTGDGDIDLTQVTGAVTLHTGDGDIATHALTSPAVSIGSGDGNLLLELANSPQQIRIDDRRRGRRRLPAPRRRLRTR